MTKCARASLVFLCLALGLSASGAAEVGQLKALLIGNGHYSHDDDISFDSLDDVPIHDANGMLKALLRNGFEKDSVKIVYDQNYDEFLSALEEFKRQLTPNDKVLVYFSGHGFSLGGENFLVPIGFRFAKTKSDTAKAAIALQQILDRISIANTKAVILDACRTSRAF